MAAYSITAVLWHDHFYADRQALPGSPDDFFDIPTLSIGIVVDESDQAIILASTIEPNKEEATYLVIRKAAIVARKKYGKIEVKALK